MKKVVLTFGFLLVAFGAFAQKEYTKRSDLQGPAYKNYKPWKHTLEPTKVYTVKKDEKLTGPAYKNYKPFTKASKKEYVAIKVGAYERQHLTGPAYKNYVPRKK